MQDISEEPVSSSSHGGNEIEPPRAFSRKAGFSSRGFLKEVLDGRKRLTSLSFPKVIKAQALPPALKSYFSYLVFLEEPELNYDNLSPASIQQNLKEKMQSQLQQAENEGPMAKTLFKSFQVLEVYTALANRNPGAVIKDVVSRTGYDDQVCLRNLEYLVAQNIVAEKNNRFKAFNPHAVYSSVGVNDGIKIVYLDSLTALKKKASARFNGNDQLFSQSFFSVNRHRMPELRKRLREVLHEYIETYETDDGDSIAKLIVGLYS